jgi:hypothetical protein
MFRKGLEIENFAFYKGMIISQPDFKEIFISKEWEEFLTFEPK